MRIPGTHRNRLGALLVIAVIGAGGVLVQHRLTAPTQVVATFSSATAIYPGDDVRVAGVRVGRIDSITPRGTQATVVMSVDHDIAIPADARAVIVAQNLISARYVQLTPTYTTGPTMASGARIPLDRTAVPVEWDEVKQQLNRLATDLGPKPDQSATSVQHFIDSTATALAGNGEKLRATLAQLAGVARILREGGGDIVGIVENLQTFVAVLRSSNEQLVEFQGHLASLSSTLNGSRSDLDDALTNLSVALGEVRRFVAGSRNQTTEQVQRLTNVTTNLVQHRTELEQVLHVAPNALANSYSMFDPRTGGAGGVFVVNNFSDPVKFLCGMVGSVANVTAPESAKLCADYLGPALSKANFNYVPFPINPILEAVPTPDKLIYSDPKLAPGGPGPDSHPAPTPATSAYGGDDPPDAPPPPAPADTAPTPPPGAADTPPLPSSPPTPGLPALLLPAERPPS
ncbi:mammalian cell entry protein [Mycolicibacterium madagascariense]|uniref:Mammalian cell entry protein n=1 Tax=Mycolicibacterium madagascariense TaxID=212765 RepID=A0A7I7X8V7_9MYCO|nr:MCE family protein [Mycolicibacterium madagascariense]MCV7014161.1 MCE family protein [Mycolicibacterium madagascariense]BBZ25770.1 mammalian cell entry protein [Mycolicibacterium madagascariense]